MAPLATSTKDSEVHAGLDMEVDNHIDITSNCIAASDWLSPTATDIIVEVININSFTFPQSVNIPLKPSNDNNIYDLSTPKNTYMIISSNWWRIKMHLPSSIEKWPCIWNNAKSMLYLNMDSGHLWIPCLLFLCSLSNAREQTHDMWTHTICRISKDMKIALLHWCIFCNILLECKLGKTVKQSTISQQEVVIASSLKRTIQMTNNSTRKHQCLELG